MTPLKLLDLFSGIGGFSLGLERSGAFETVAFCEVEPFCRRSLRKNWQEVPCYDDIRTLTAGRLASDGIAVDAICGGFPCQDVSIAGKGAGLAGERSGLWFEYARLIGELRPQYVIVENVVGLLGRGLDAVLGSLAALGYDAEWHCIPASRVGSIQNRDRIWIIAYNSENGMQGLFQSFDFSQVGQGWACGPQDLPEIFSDPLGSNRWPQPLICRGNGRPAHWVDRIGAVGNAVVPQIPELIGLAIAKHIRGKQHDPETTAQVSQQARHG